MLNNKLSIKQKSIFFVLFLISILLLTLYFQNSASNKNYLSQIETNYKKSFDNYYSLFKKNLIHFYEIQTKYIQDNQENINQLILKEEFLKKINIVNFKEEEISTIYIEEAKKGKSFIDIQLLNETIFYKVIVPIKKENNIDSYFEYILDSRVLLQSLQDFDGSNGILLTGDNNISNNIFLEEYRNSEYFKQLAIKCKESYQEPIVEFLSNFYVKKELVLKDFRSKDVANATFFLDITKDKKSFISLVQDSFFTTILLFIIASIVVNYFFSYLINRIKKNEEELKEINKNLETKVEKEIEHRLEIEKEALKEKEKSNQLLVQQSKLAMLGEMIGNIAHQWRQPLMQLSAIIMYLDAYNEKGKLTPEKFNKKVREGNSIINFMSSTIEDFRNYYKPEKQKEEFFIKDSIDGALFIVNSALKHENIKMNINYSEDDLKIESFKNEFSQALLNIITNAKDTLIQRKVDNPSINIDVLKENDEIIIHIIDNAGGIEEDIINKIFDPYFTTKHQSQGTGIGLYMTKMIIENNMNGSINVENENDGAKFIINLKYDSIRDSTVKR